MINLAEFLNTLQIKPTNTSILAMTDYSQGSFRGGVTNNSFQNDGFQLKKFQRFFKKSPMFPFGIIIVIVFVIAIFGISSVIRKSTTNVTRTSAATTTQQSQQQVNAPTPVATETLNKDFSFPLKDATGKVVSNIDYEIQSAEFDNQVIIKGEEATAIQGKTFLVLNLKITNNYDKAVQLNTRDYVRLTVNSDSSEKLAASIHNDPVDVEPISTTFTRIGFPVDTDVKSLSLEVGQIDGTKQTIPLAIQY